MKKALLALALLIGCVRQRDVPSSFLDKGMREAVDAAVADVLTAHPEARGLQRSMGSGQTNSYLAPAHFQKEYEITFHRSIPRLPVDCVYTLSSRLPEQAAAHGARVMTRRFPAPGRFEMTYTAGSHHGTVVVSVRPGKVDIVANES